MLDTLRRMIGRFSGGSSAFEGEEDLVAAAALLVHVATVDGKIDFSERQHLVALLHARYGLGSNEAKALIAVGEREDSEALDLTDFTDVLRRSLDAEGRAGLVEMLWELAKADGPVHEFEENLIARVAELLDLDGAEAGAIRERVLQGT